MQTDADCERVVDGMASVDGADKGSAKGLAGVLKRLSPRWFLMRDAHVGGEPVLLQPRWAMSLLRGPMTRLEIQRARAEWDRTAPAVAAEPA